MYGFLEDLVLWFYDHMLEGLVVFVVIIVFSLLILEKLNSLLRKRDDYGNNAELD